MMVLNNIFIVGIKRIKNTFLDSSPGCTRIGGDTAIFDSVGCVCYVVFYSSSNQTDASNICVQHGGHLVTTTSTYQLGLIGQLLPARMLAWTDAGNVHTGWFWTNGLSLGNRQIDFSCRLIHRRTYSIKNGGCLFINITDIPI